MWVWEHALFNYNPKRPDSTKKDKTVEVITKADHDAALRRAKAEAKAEGLRQAKQYVERKIQIGADFIGGPDPNVQRRVALLEVIEYCDKRIATLLDARDVRSGIRASRTHGLERGGRAHE
jgi:hypothetical protein